MPKYLLKVNYVGEGIQGLLEEGGTRRRAAAEALVKSLGGSLETMYFAFGETDVYAIGELPNTQAAAALALTLGASGRVTCETVVLLTPEEVDAAARLTPHYRAPGR